MPIETPASQSQFDAPAPAAPPTRPGALATSAPASWPTVVGVIVIVYGAIEVGGLVVALWTMSLGLAGDGNDPENAAGGFVPAQAPFQLPMTIIGAGLTALLLAGGIGLVRRRRWSVKALRFWAWPKILLALVSIVQVYWVLQANNAAIASTSGAPAMPPGFYGMMLIMGVLATLAWVLPLPVFLLLWLPRQRVRAEIARWKL